MSKGADNWGNIQSFGRIKQDYIDFMNEHVNNNLPLRELIREFLDNSDVLDEDMSIENDLMKVFFDVKEKKN